MNLVERFFRDLTEAVVREGSFTSARQLTQAIMQYLAERNLAPRRYVWKQSGAEILASTQRAREALAAQTAAKWVMSSQLRGGTLETGLSDRQRKALLFIRENGSIQTSQYREFVHIGQRQAVKDLNELVARGLACGPQTDQELRRSRSVAGQTGAVGQIPGVAGRLSSAGERPV